MIPDNLMQNQSRCTQFLYLHEVFTSLPKHSISQPNLDTNYNSSHGLAPEYINLKQCNTSIASNTESQSQTQTFKVISHNLMLHQNGYLQNEKVPLQLPVVPTKNHYLNNIIKT